MNYIGSKAKLSSWLKDEIQNVAGSLQDKVFCDIFAGTGAVGRAFKLDVKKLISNDLEYYSYVINKNYIQNHQALEGKSEFIKKLNSLPLRDDGFIYKHYCQGGGSARGYFKDENGKKIDAIRSQIQKWQEDRIIDDEMFYFLLTSLLESADTVANTASVYGSFLKDMKKLAQKELVLTPANFELCKNKHEVYNEDANTLITKIKGDILYLDPPYNHRQYGLNYHILNTIALYDKFIPQSKIGLREYARSDYCSTKKVAKSFEELIKNANFRYIFLSYNNEGLMKEGDIRNIMQKYGKYHLAKKEHRRFKNNKLTCKTPKGKKTYEFLHVIEKTP